MVPKYKLTPNQLRFCNEWLIDGNGLRSYRAAYPNIKNNDVARAAASRLLTLANVKSYIERRQAELSRKYKITQERVLLEEACIAFFDPRNLFDQDGRLLSIHEMDGKYAEGHFRFGNRPLGRSRWRYKSPEGQG